MRVRVTHKLDIGRATGADLTSRIYPPVDGELLLLQLHYPLIVKRAGSVWQTTSKITRIDGDVLVETVEVWSARNVYHVRKTDD